MQIMKYYDQNLEGALIKIKLHSLLNLNLSNTKLNIVFTQIYFRFLISYNRYKFTHKL